MNITLRSRVVSNPRILGGTPVVEGTRVPAENVLAEFRHWGNRMEVFVTYPSLPLDAIETCLEWERTGSTPAADQEFNLLKNASPPRVPRTAAKRY